MFVDYGRHVIEHLLYQAEEVLDLVVPRLLEYFCLMAHYVHYRFDAKNGIVFIFDPDQSYKDIHHIHGIWFEWFGRTRR